MIHAVIPTLFLPLGASPMVKPALTAAVAGLLLAAATAAAPPASPPAPAIPPTAANVPYGPLERQVLDFWQAKADKPTPVVICIHGGGSSLWLAFHDDMADPASSDPVARESTRLACAAVNGARVSLDPREVRDWLPYYTYGAHAFGLPNLDEVEQQREKTAPWIAEYSPLNHVTKEDPSIGLYYGGVPGAKVGEIHKDPTHSPILGLKLAEKLRTTGVDVVFHSNTEPNTDLPNANAFLIDRLTK